MTTTKKKLRWSEAYEEAKSGSVQNMVAHKKAKPNNR